MGAWDKEAGKGGRDWRSVGTEKWMDCMCVCVCVCLCAEGGCLLMSSACLREFVSEKKHNGEREREFHRCKMKVSPRPTHF